MSEVILNKWNSFFEMFFGVNFHLKMFEPRTIFGQEVPTKFSLFSKTTSTFRVWFETRTILVQELPENLVYFQKQSRLFESGSTLERGYVVVGFLLVQKQRGSN
jgi:hypothetical protein